MSPVPFVTAEPGPGARGLFASWLGPAPASLDLNILRGAHYRHRLRLLAPDPSGQIPVIIDGQAVMHRPQDLTGAEGIAQVRGFDGSFMLALQVSVIGLATSGWLQVSADAAATGSLPAHLEYQEWSATWQLVLTCGLEHLTPARGRVQIVPGAMPLPAKGG